MGKRVNELTKATAKDLVASSSLLIDTEKGTKGLPADLLALRSGAYGEYWYEGVFSSGAFFEFPIRKEVGRNYKISVTTTASKYNLYVFKSGQSGTGRSVSNNSIISYTADDLAVGRDCLRIFFNTASNDSASIKISVDCNTSDSITNLNNAMNSCEDRLDVCERNDDGIKVASGTFSSNQYYEFPLAKLVGEKYLPIVTTTASKYNLYVFKSGQSGTGRSVSNNNFFTYTADDLAVGRDCLRIFFNTASNDSATMVLHKVNAASTTLQDVNSTRSVAIMGASYCTYSGWIPEGQIAYYPLDSHPDVNDVSICWWHQVLEKMGWTLLLNDSWSGTTICNSVVEGYSSSSSMVNRAESSFGLGKTLSPKPSAFFLCGGINDTNLGTSVGDCKYSEWTDEDLLQVAPAFCKMVDTIKKYNPGALIINVSCNVSNDIDEKMQEACEYYGIVYVKVSGITGDYTINGHPNAEGMTKMADTVVSELKKLLWKQSNY